VAAGKARQAEPAHTVRVQRTRQQAERRCQAPAVRTRVGAGRFVAGNANRRVKLVGGENAMCLRKGRRDGKKLLQPAYGHGAQARIVHTSAARTGSALFPLLPPGVHRSDARAARIRPHVSGERQARLLLAQENGRNSVTCARSVKVARAWQVAQNAVCVAACSWRAWEMRQACRRRSPPLSACLNHGASATREPRLLLPAPSAADKAV